MKIFLKSYDELFEDEQQSEDIGQPRFDEYPESLKNDIESFVVYADNASQQILVSANLAQASYCLYNTQGAKLHSGTIDSALAIDAKGLSAGVYFVSLTTANKRLTRKVVLH